MEPERWIVEALEGLGADTRGPRSEAMILIVRRLRFLIDEARAGRIVGAELLAALEWTAEDHDPDRYATSFREVVEPGPPFVVDPPLLPTVEDEGPDGASD